MHGICRNPAGTDAHEPSLSSHHWYEADSGAWAFSYIDGLSRDLVKWANVWDTGNGLRHEHEDIPVHSRRRNSLMIPWA